MHRSFILHPVIIILFLTAISSHGRAQVSGDFQTNKTSGNWSDVNSWNIYKGGAWITNTTDLPNITSNVFIQAGNTILIDDANAMCKDLNVNGSNSSKIAFSNPAGILNVKGDMTLFSISHNCFDAWTTGAKIVFSGTGSQAFINLSSNTEFVNVEVNKFSGTLNNFAGLRINTNLYLTEGTFNIGAGGSLTLNGAALTATGGKLISTNSSDLIITGVTGGTVVLPLKANISLRNIIVSGTRTLQMNDTNNINLSGNFTIANGATYDNGGESEIIDGSEGSIDIFGTFITRDKDGFFGTGAAVPGIIPVLNPGCTIEYGRLGNQLVQGSAVSYQNISFSGNGIKIPSSSFTPAGTLTITGSAILDASGNNIGDGTGDTTNFVMDGGKLILGTTGTQPRMDGIFNLTGGLIQFTNSGVTRQTIRSPKTYYAIEVTGTNVGNSSGNITLAPGGSFTVKSGGKFNINNRQITDLSGTPGIQTVTVEEGAEFECGNEDGFSGGNGSNQNSTSINSRIETISFEPGSLVTYMRNGDQTITNQIPYQNITITGRGDKTAPQGSIVIEGNFSIADTSSFIHNSGTVLLNGITQTFAGLTYNNLILSGSGVKTTSGNSTIIDSLKIAVATTLNLASNDTVFLHSDAAKTARIGQVEGAITYGGNTKFVVERYISAKRAWRFLSVPVKNSTLTFHQSWQEGEPRGSVNQTSPAGYGTQITSNVTPDVLNGFDYYSNGASVKKYISSNGKWLGINSTNDLIETKEGFMIFVRGDRTAKGLSATPVSTVLRTNGELYTGDMMPVEVSAGLFTPVGNPYASPVDMRTIDRTADVDSFFYIWDPKLTGEFGYGGFQIFTYIGNEYFPTPGGGSYGEPDKAYNVIAGGQAFFVHGKTGGNVGRLTFKEKDKTTTDISLAFRSESTLVQTLRNNLYVIEKDSSAVLVDGVLNIIADNYNNAIDEKDGLKVSNFSENLAIKNKKSLLSVEKKHTITDRDTIFYNLSNVKTGSYRFHITANNFSQGNLTAALQDTWLHINTPVDLGGSSLFNFEITSDSGSWNPNRFRLLFDQSGPLPVTFTIVKALQQNKNISVQWNVENELNSKEYIIEKSSNGLHFVIVKTVKTKGNNSNSNSYLWLDENPVPGANFYRLNRVGINGDTQYSAVVKVIITKGKPQVLVNPNPIMGNVINLQLINQPEYNFNLKVFNGAGQLLASVILVHQGGSSSHAINIEKELPAGMYWLQIIGKNNIKYTIKISR